MAFITREIFLINKKIVISVKFPETAVEYVEMLIREEFSDLVYVLLPGNHEKSLFQCGPLKVPEIDLSIVIHVYLVKDPHNHSIRISILKLWCLLQEL